MRRRFTLQLHHQGQLHLHGCPQCHERHECRHACTLVPDLADANDPRPMGDYHLCPNCEWARCPECANDTTEGHSGGCDGLHLEAHWKPTKDLDPKAPCRWCDACGLIWNVEIPE